MMPLPIPQDFARRLSKLPILDTISNETRL